MSFIARQIVRELEEKFVLFPTRNKSCKVISDRSEGQHLPLVQLQVS